MKKKKILHLTILNGAGSGHKSATYATIDAIDKYYPGKYEHKIVDLIEFFNPRVRKIIEGALENIISVSKNVYKALFQITHRTDLPGNLDKRIYHLIKNDLDKIIDSDLDAIISYFPFFTFSVRRFLDEKNYNIPFIIQITDTGEVHSAWMQDIFDHYLALTEETKFWLTERGIDEKRINIFGLPLRQDFYNKYIKSVAKEKLRVGKEPLIFYFNSGWTGGSVMKKIKAIDNNIMGITIFVTCGGNDKLKSLLKDTKFNNKVIIKGFINNVPEILAASDLVISKAGGASTAEIMKMKVPSIITEIIPGQEEPNARFIESMGFGYIEKTSKLLAKRVKYILNSNDLERMKNNLNSYHIDDNASRNVAKFINDLF